MFAILRNWNEPANRMKAALFGGPRGITRGTWLSDLAACGKAVMLCALCKNRWNAARNGYERRMVGAGYHEARGECDGCGAANELCAMYLPKETKR